MGFLDGIVSGIGDTISGLFGQSKADKSAQASTDAQNKLYSQMAQSYGQYFPQLMSNMMGGNYLSNDPYSNVWGSPGTVGYGAGTPAGAPGSTAVPGVPSPTMNGAHPPQRAAAPGAPPPGAAAPQVPQGSGLFGNLAPGMFGGGPGAATGATPPRPTAPAGAVGQPGQVTPAAPAYENPYGNIPGSTGNPYSNVPGATGDPYAQSGNSIVGAYNDKVAPQAQASVDALQNDLVSRNIGGSSLSPSMMANIRTQQGSDLANYGRNLGINAEQLQYNRGITNDNEQWNRGVQGDNTAYGRGVAGDDTGYSRMANMLGMLMGQGSNAATGYGTLASSYGNTAKNQTGNAISIASMFA